MKTNKKTWLVAASAFLLGAGFIAVDQKRTPETWIANNPKTPLPPVVKAGDTPSDAPSDAIVLFDGTSLDNWEMQKDRSNVKWKLDKNDKSMTVTRTGGIQTKQKFGSCQLHLEWATPSVVKGNGQGRGNSGVFLQGIYEIQILDNYKNKTYADGHAGAIYGQYPPLANVVKAPGQWNTYDIVFTAPKFDKNGKCVRAPRFTAFLNGVLVQNNVELFGRGGWKKVSPFRAHPDKLPIALQDHSNPVKFRNIWIRPLKD